jgi:hypothetical protein
MTLSNGAPGSGGCCPSHGLYFTLCGGAGAGERGAGTSPAGRRELDWRVLWLLLGAARLRVA